MAPKATIKSVVGETATETASQEGVQKDEAIMNEIKGLLRELKGDGVTGKEFRLYSADELSRIAGSLANLKANLAEIVAKSYRDSRIEGGVMKLKKANVRGVAIKSLNEAGEKVTEAKITAIADKRLFKERVRRAFIEELENKALYLWRAVNDNLRAIECRINVLLSQSSDVRLMDDGMDFPLGTDGGTEK